MKNSKISLLDLIGIGVGQIIGSGVMILTGIAVGKTGHGVTWAFIVAGIIVAITNLCLATLGSAIPANGGMYTYVRDLIGKKNWFLLCCTLSCRSIGISKLCNRFLRIPKGACSFNQCNFGFSYYDDYNFYCEFNRCKNCC